MMRLSLALPLLRPLLSKGAVHVFSVGFEDRCLAYPQWLRDNCATLERQRFVCVNVEDRAVSSYLRGRQSAHRQVLQHYFPSIQAITPEDLVRRVEQYAGLPGRPVFIDISSLPRRYILRLGNPIAEMAGTRRVFLVYTYPAKYYPGPLQVPLPEFDVVPTDLELPSNPSRLLLIPGFDTEYTNLVLSAIRSRGLGELSVRWLFPFANRYEFYERAVEAHLHLLGEQSVALIAQDQLGLCLRQLLNHIEEAPGDVFISPLGPRVVCAAVALALTRSRLIGNSRRVAVLVPRTSQYNSLRSGGAAEPLLEEVGVHLRGAPE